VSSESQYLLVLGCSKRKRPEPGLVPAIERYDGVNFRVLRKAIREGYWPSNLDMLILSAKYGLIEQDTLIKHYDLSMTFKRANTIQANASADLDAQLKRKSYNEVFINLGKNYMVALALSKELKTVDNRVHYPVGGIGEKMSQMKMWLQDISAGGRK